MRFLVDAQLPPALADWIGQKGFLAEHVFGIVSQACPDEQIAQIARSLGAVVVSKDDDFLRLQVDGAPRMIWVRLGNSTNRRLLERFEAEWPSILAALAQGEAVVELH